MRLERGLDRVSVLGALFVAGWLSCSAYYAIPHLWRTQAQLVSQVKCEDRRGNLTAQIAKKAIVAAQTDSGRIPTQKAIPKDCPHVIPTEREVIK